MAVLKVMNVLLFYIIFNGFSRGFQKNKIEESQTEKN